MIASKRFGAWRSLVARLLWEQKVAGSSPAAPTSIKTRVSEAPPGPVLLLSPHLLTLIIGRPGEMQAQYRQPAITPTERAV